MYKNFIISILLLAALGGYLFQNGYKEVYGIACYRRFHYIDKVGGMPKENDALLLISKDMKYVSMSRNIPSDLKYGQKYFSNWISVYSFENKIGSGEWGPWKIISIHRFND